MRVYFEKNFSIEKRDFYQRTSNLMQKVYALRRHTISKSLLDIIDDIFQQPNVYLPDQVAHLGLLWINIRLLSHDRP